MSKLLSISLPLQDPVLIITVIILIILLSPMVLERIRIPGIAGLLIFGMLIGPNGFNIIPQSLELSLFSTTGLLYLMFLAGLEIDLVDFIENKGKSLGLGLLSFAFPFLLGMGLSYYVLGLGLLPSLLIGSMLSSHTLISYPIVSKMGIITTTIVTIIIGGTIIADVLALVSLQFISDYTNGLFDAQGILKMAGNFTGFGVFVLLVVPWLSKQFFRHFDGDLIIQYLFILALLFLSATAAELFHIEPIIGAFLSGLVLNRNIIHGSPLYQRIEFIGNSLFIPVFLISVGLLVNPVYYFDNPASLWPLTLLIVVAVLGKHLSALTTRWLFRLNRDEGRLITGMTSARAASAIAIVLVGYKLGLIPEVYINHTVVLILVTSVWSSWYVQKHGKAIADQAAEKPGERTTEVIVVPVSNPSNVPSLLKFAGYIRDRKESKSIYGLSVLANVATVQQQIEQYKLIFKKAVTGLQSDHPYKLITRIDSTVTNGIAKAMKEMEASIMIMGWHEKATPFEVLFGNVIEHVLARTNKMVWILKTPVTRFNNAGTIHLFMPDQAHYELGYPQLILKINQLAKTLKDKIHLHASDQMITAVEEDFRNEMKGYFQGTTTHGFRDEQTLELVPLPTDLFLIVSSRKHGISYQKAFDRFTLRLVKQYTDVNVVFVYPEQL